jgi:acyl-CoA dehydrogenase
MESLLFGFLGQHLGFLGSCAILAGSLLCLGYFGVSLFFWSSAVVVLLWVLGLPKLLLLLIAAPLVVFNLPQVRRQYLSKKVMQLFKKMKLLPAISQTERIALEAGSTWVDGELFSGKPDFERILSEPYGKLTLREQQFIKNQCAKICDITEDYRAWEEGDLSREVWDYLKKERFLGLIIPEEYGGLGFSALAHSTIVGVLSSRSIPLSISCMVPNSLGPAELLIHYGTKEQKDYYLPRLARGEEIPCFGLTEPQAGSDAGSMTSTAVLFKKDDGKLYLKMNWDKRYITLGAVSTVLGLAVKLYDPDNILGKGTDLGLTCVLVPSSTPGVTLGKRHDPLGVPFFNCPIYGKDVVVSVDQIIGGLDGAGHGWKMLMECLAAGRAISLPAQAIGGAKAVTRNIGAYASIRHQFGLSIGNFEGVAEAMARIGGMTYLLEAMRIYTVGAVDQGIKPSIVSAIAKLNSTEIARKLINDAMDVSGGQGISRGPRNLFAHGYIGAPIAITVEGANILTRTMIIFGQGAIRCHPFAYKQVVALENNDLDSFDKAFWGHIGHGIRNFCRTVVLSLTRGRLVQAPKSPMAEYYRKLSWASASFALLADVSMASLGGSLKFKEQITGRLADILSWMYLITATLRRYEAEGQQRDHEIFVHYSVQFGFVQIQNAFDGIFANFDVPVIGTLLRYPIAFWSRLNRFGALPSDRVGRQIAKAMMTPGAQRDALSLPGIYIPKDKNEIAAVLENALVLNHQAKEVLRKIKVAMRERILPFGKPHKATALALEKGVISQEEFESLAAAQQAMLDATRVDAFELGAYKKGVANAVEHKVEVKASRA